MASQPVPPASTRRTLLDDGLPWLAVLALTALYMVTGAPAPIPGDPAELVVAAATLGVSHPTGYPLYVLLGKAATLAVPFVSPAALLNALSGVYLALALILLAIVLRRVGMSAGVTAGVIAVLGTTPSLWGSATVAEVYTLHVLLLALILVLMDHAAVRPSPVAVAVVFLVAGLALGNHMTSVLLVPGLVLWLLWLGRSGRLRLRPVTVGGAAAAYLAGAGVLLLLLALDRGGGYNYIDQYALEFPSPLFARPLGRILWLLSGEQYSAASGVLRSVLSGSLASGLLRVGSALLRDNPVLILLGVAGLGAAALRPQSAAPRRRALAVFLLVTAVLDVLYFATYAARFETAFCSQLYLCCAFGLAALAERAARPAWARTALAWGLVLLATVSVGRHLVAIDKGGTEVYERETARVLAALEPDAVVFTTWRNSTLLWYEQRVRGAAPGVTVVNARPSSWARLARRFPGRPLYFENIPPGADPASFRPVLHLFGYLPSLGRGAPRRVGS